MKLELDPHQTCVVVNALETRIRTINNLIDIWKLHSNEYSNTLIELYQKDLVSLNQLIDTIWRKN